MSTITLTLMPTQRRSQTAGDCYGSLLTTTAVHPRPIPNSYWATPLLLACEFPWDPREQYNPKIDALLRAGVRTFIDLTERGELEPYDTVLGERASSLEIDPSTIEYHCFPIRDRCLPQSIQLVHQVMAVLEDNERRGRLTAIHCRGGVGRTGTLVGCWLVYSRIAKDGEEALTIVDLLWKTVPKSKRIVQSPETGAQYDFVLKFRRDIDFTVAPVA
ncbi:dual specificity protein phosphatase [Amanita muscaria]